MKTAAAKQQNPDSDRKIGSLEIKVAHSAADWRRAKEALGREHGLGAGSEAGDRLCQLVLEDGKLAGVLVWCAAAWHLKDRDEAVGWDAVTRSERLKLVVQLRLLHVRHRVGLQLPQSR